MKNLRTIPEKELIPESLKKKWRGGGERKERKTYYYIKAYATIFQPWVDAVDVYRP